MDNPENIIKVRGAYKNYGNNVTVLKGLDMTVQRGTIYAFLGPSGCGKTTLLKCIVGRTKLDAGEISVSVGNKSDIGYMPQELALLVELTIEETLTYYGWMYDIGKDQLTERKQKLFKILQLPKETRVIETLSGGQQRRVSLCVALIHDPKLLILDEPTAGVDPVLRSNIWNYLLELSTVENKSIIITTHYIEEARQGHKVGMLRGGVLLVEGEAQALMSQYNCETLEEVFLQLSQDQENTRTKKNKLMIENYSKPSNKPKAPLESSKWIKTNHLVANIFKNLYFIRRSQITWIMLFIVPIIQCVLFELATYEPKGLKFGVLNEELFNVTDCKYFSNLTCFPSSCKFITAMERKPVKLINYGNKDIADDDLMNNHIWGFLHFYANFTESLYDRINYPRDTDEDVLLGSEISVVMDMSNSHIGNVLKKNIIDAFFDYISLLKTDCNWKTDHIKLPIKNHDPIYGIKNPRFSDFSIVGIVIILEFFLPVAYSQATLKDKMDGVLDRNLVAGMNNLEILTGHAAFVLVVFIIQTMSMMVVLYGLFDHKMDGSFILALSLIFLIGVSGMCFAYMLALMCDRDSTALYLSLGSFAILANISGLFWPTEGMHYLLRSIRLFLPLGPCVDAYRGIAERAWTITNPIVYIGFSSIIGYIFVLCLSIYLIVKLKNN